VTRSGGAEQCIAAVTTTRRRLAIIVSPADFRPYILPVDASAACERTTSTIRSKFEEGERITAIERGRCD